MKRLIEKHQKSRGKLFSSELAAKMESRLNPTKSVSDTTNEVTRLAKESASNKKRTAATKEAIKKDSKKSNSLKIGQRVTIASRTNPEDVRVERILLQKETPILTERQVNPNIDAEQFRQLKLQHYENELLNQDFYNKVLPTLGNFSSMFFPSTWVGAVADKNRSFLGSMVEGNKGLGEIDESAGAGTNLLFDIVSPAAWTKGLNLTGKYVPKLMLLYNSPLTGRWTLFGNNMYRLTPRASAVLPGLDKKALTKFEEEMKAKFGTETFRKYSIREKEALAKYAQDNNSSIIYLPRPNTKFKPILESDMELIQLAIDRPKEFFKEYIVPSVGNTPERTVSMLNLGNGKLPISYNEALSLMFRNSKPISDAEFFNPLLSATAKTELRRALLIRNKISKHYAPGMEEIREKTLKDFGGEIDWDWWNGGILAESNIPSKVAISPVFDPIAGRVVNPTPIMLRFYDNVLNKEGIIQKTMYKLLNNGTLKYLDGVGYTINTQKGLYLVDPTRFILNYILENELKSTNRTNFVRYPNEPASTFIPFHGTSIGDKNLTRQYQNPALRALFASIQDSSPGFAPLKRAYLLTTYGTSIPLLRKIPEYELDKLVSVNGLHGSNNYGDVGELMSHFNTNGGKAREIQEVSDVRNIRGNTGQRQNEYNYGAGTPGIASYLNTMDMKDASLYGPFQGFKKGGKLIKK